jgi:hypothetical protein
MARIARILKCPAITPFSTTFPETLVHQRFPDFYLA